MLSYANHAFLKTQQNLDTISSGTIASSAAADIVTCADIYFENCLIQGSQSYGFNAAMGFFFEKGCSNIYMKGCTAQNLSILPGATASIGAFRFETCNQVVVEDCVAQDVFAADFLYAAGFQISPAENDLPSTNALFKNCVAQNIVANHIETGPGIFAAGFASVEDGQTSPSLGVINQNIIFQDCVAQNVVFNLNGVPTPSYAYGFHVNATEGLEITNCVSQDNGLGYLLDIAQTGTSVLFSTLSDNIAINNSVAGFVDNTITDTLGTNVFFGNTAYQNGQNYLGTGLGTDYGMAAGTPFRTWDFTGGDQPSPLTDAGNNPSALDNISIT